MCPKDADRMANSVDPDQTAPLDSLWLFYTSIFVSSYPLVFHDDLDLGVQNSKFQTDYDPSIGILFQKRATDYYLFQNWFINLLHAEISYIIDIACHWTFFSNITSFSYFLERQNPVVFFSPFSSSQILPNCTVEFMFTIVRGWLLG